MDIQMEIKKFCKILNENTIQYCLVEWREQENVLEMFVHPESNSFLQELLLSRGYKKIKSNSDEYAFIYRLMPDAFWKAENEMIIHVAVQMSCISLSNLSKCMLPLDDCIQKSIWDNKYWDVERESWIISEEDYLIFWVTEAVFNLKDFNEDIIKRINNCNVDYDSKSLEYKLESVFFRFTHLLIVYLKEGSYNKIISSYRTFYDY